MSKITQEKCDYCGAILSKLTHINISATDSVETRIMANKHFSVRNQYDFCNTDCMVAFIKTPKRDSMQYQ